MIKVHCRTNLDLRGEQWPSDMPAIPRVGERIQSMTKWGTFQLTLEVVAVTWEHSIVHDWDINKEAKVWVPSIELHMTSFHRGLPCRSGKGETGSIRAFYEWYAPLVGRDVSSFI